MENIIIKLPANEGDIKKLEVGMMVYVSGCAFCGRDAVLSRIKYEYEHGVSLKKYEFDGGMMFHTAVSPAGIGPTSSNKTEIEESMALLSDMGIRIHLGKGQISDETIRMISERNSVYAVIPPVTALLMDRTSDIKCVAYPELGMEALYRINVHNYPIIIAGAKGKNIFYE